MKKERTRSTDSGYESFLKGLGSVSLGLESCSARLERSGYWDLQTRRKDSVRILRDEYKLARIHKEYFNVSAEFTLDVRDAKTSGGVLNVSCVFRGHIHGKAPIDAEHARRFTDSDLRIVVVPYFRHFVSDITARMTIPPLFVPFALESLSERQKKRLNGKERKQIKA